MELILINSNKLKIMLTTEDMIKYELDCNTVNYSNTETRRAFWSILDEAKHRTGFDAASDRLFIQLYPSKDGGCELYVTKIGLLCQSVKPDINARADFPSILPDGAMRVSFIFKSVGLMISACRLATRSGQITDSTAWVDDDGLCYLFAQTSKGANSAYLSGIMSEFGSAADDITVTTYIKEHGHAFCRHNAIETLSVL